jgi:hypothetical protein
MLRYTAILASYLALDAIAGAEEPDLAALVAAAERRRDANVREVRSVREYVVRNPRWQADATMHVTMITSADGSKQYEIIRTNAEGLRRKILVKILDGEVQAAARQDRDGNVNARNYELRPMLANTQSSEPCRVVTLVPRTRTRFTLDGQACVDMSDMAMVRMEGRTAKRISFLVSRADVIQQFRKLGEFWYSSTSHSTADVKFLGRTELIIKYLDYTITSKTGVVTTANLRRDGPSAP